VNNLPAGVVAASTVSAGHIPEEVVSALLIGVDLGPNLSVTGSLATILWLTALRRDGGYDGALAGGFSLAVQRGGWSMRRALRAACSAALSLAIGLFASAPAALPASASTLPPSLAGEVLQATGPTGSATCNPAGTSSASFSAAGNADGPYTGTFTESGTVTWGPQAPGRGPLLTFHANFTIRAPSATIVGTKDLSAIGAYAASEGRCYGGPDFYFVTNATYQATISATGGGAFSDSGYTHLFVYCGLGCPSGFLAETFAVSNGVKPLAPASRVQCKDGGWQGYPQFKNQGDCVSFVSNGR